MSDKEELERLKSEKNRADEKRWEMVSTSLVRIERNQAVQSEQLTRVEGEQKRTTKILYGDESDNTPGVVKRVDRLEGKMKLVWGSVTASIGALFHGIIK